MPFSYASINKLNYIYSNKLICFSFIENKAIGNLLFHILQFPGPQTEIKLFIKNNCFQTNDFHVKVVILNV